MTVSAVRHIGIFLLLSAAVFHPGAAASGADAGKVVEKNWNSLWDTGRAFWLKELQGGLSPVSGGEDKLRYYALQNKVKHTFFGMPLEELNLIFAGDKLSAVEVSVYNRGDAGAMNARYLNTLVKRLSSELDRFAGQREKKETAMLGSARIESQLWKNENGSAQLKWSKNSDRAEFLNVAFLPPGEAKKLKNAVGAGLSAAELRNKAEKTPSGGVILKIPMVNQGGKGYCAAAVAARILNYYGSEADQHIIADLAGTDARAGTGIDSVLNELKNAAPRLNVRMKILYRNPHFSGIDGLKRMLSAYNVEAKKNNARPVSLEDFVVDTPEGRVLQVSEMFQALDQKSFEASRAREKRKMEDFFRDVETSLREGVPVAWINVGVDPEMGYIQHVRIINGIEPGAKKIVYTDSWGGVGTGKSMEMSRAWAITSAAFVLIPREK